MKNRKQIISEFDGMKIDMDYMLNIPSVHAFDDGGSIIMDFGGGVRKVHGTFPEERIQRLREWVMSHKEEIMENHYRCGHSQFPLLSIEPL